ncbi:MAG: alpha/beta hydrolase [Rickettsiaceae bacterium]
MHKINLDKYDRYKFEYKKFVRSKPVPKYSLMPSMKVYSSDIVSLLKYNAFDAVGNLFLVVPSIFNSPEILFFSGGAGLVPKLLKYGSVCLVNWKEHNQQLLTGDLAEELSLVIKFLHDQGNKKIHLIGHCIGGNICIAAMQNNSSSYLKSLTLLTTPWDFSHFQKFALMRTILGLEKAVHNTDSIPSIYIQMMFFLMFPLQFKDKVDKYFTLPTKAKESFLRVEDWLQSGVSLPKSLYKELIGDFCLDNITMNKKWFVKNVAVEPGNITAPTCIIYASEDQIVTYNSILPLQKEIKNPTLIEVEGGHINYLVNSKNTFQKQYADWLKNVL